MKYLAILAALFLSSCATYAPQFSDQIQTLKQHDEKYKFEFTEHKIKNFKLPKMHKIDGINKKSMAKLDAERRDLRKIAKKLQSAIEKKDATIADLVRVIEILQVERDIDSKIAQRALQELDKANSKKTIEEIYGKGMSVVAILALLGVL